MSLATPTPEPSPEEIARGLAELEQHLTDLAPVPTGAELVAFDDPALPARPDGQTRRVRRLRAEVAEARLLADLQDDETPLLLDTAKVRKRRRKAQEAARLHTLGQDPAMRAYQAARMRRVLTTAAMVALTLALVWSTAGVQVFAADGAPAWSPAWVFAWLVEPFMSTALLVVVGARAYLGTRGAPLNDRTLVRIEYLFLGLTLGMNAWQHLPGVAEDFSLSRLVLHLLGPVVAVAIVTGLPIILAAFSRLDHGVIQYPPTGAAYRANAVIRYPHGRHAETPDDGDELAALTDRARRLIAAGMLPADAGADKIRRALNCGIGMTTARAIRDALRYPV